MTARFRSKSTGRFATFAVAAVLCAAASTSALAQNKAPEKTKDTKAAAPSKDAKTAQPPAAAANAPAATATAPAPAPAAGSAPAAPPVSAAPGVTLAPDYVIGADDVLSVIFWRDKELTADVTVRPDGNISIPLINDVRALGLTPALLKDRIVEEAKKYIEDPSVTVVVKEIKSRKVFITGEVRKPGPYLLTGQMTVLQLISVAGGLADYAKGEKITIVRTDGTKQMSFRFNYKEVLDQKKLTQNIELKPGDTVIVP